MSVTLTIHRGTQQIGGSCCIRPQSVDRRLVLDEPAARADTNEVSKMCEIECLYLTDSRHRIEGAIIPASLPRDSPEGWMQPSA